VVRLARAFGILNGIEMMTVFIGPRVITSLPKCPLVWQPSVWAATQGPRSLGKRWECLVGKPWAFPLLLPKKP